MLLAVTACYYWLSGCLALDPVLRAHPSSQNSVENLCLTSDSYLAKTVLLRENLACPVFIQSTVISLTGVPYLSPALSELDHGAFADTSGNTFEVYDGMYCRLDVSRPMSTPYLPIEDLIYLVFSPPCEIPGKFDIFLIGNYSLRAVPIMDDNYKIGKPFQFIDDSRLTFIQFIMHQ